MELIKVGKVKVALFHIVFKYQRIIKKSAFSDSFKKHLL